MGKFSYTEFGIEIKHVRYAVRIPELPTLKLRKPKMLKMKRPRVLKSRRKDLMNTGTLDSLNVDWKKEFDQKYADLIFKTEEKKISKSSFTTNLSSSIEERLHPDLDELSFSSSRTYTLPCSPVSLDRAEHADKLLFMPNLAEMKQDQENFETRTLKAKTPSKPRKLRYSYHVLQKTNV